MPVKWTPENDQLLLLKILKTHDLSVDTKKVAEAWPAIDAKDKPTPRAITQRLVRMRQTARASGNADGFAIKSAPATPKKPRNTTTSTPASDKTKSPDSTKRARTQNADVTEDEDMADVETPTKPSRSVKKEPEGKAIKLELAELDDVHVPTKRVRKSSALPLGMVEYSGDAEKWEEDETVYDSSASEFVPEDGSKREDES